jgi:hypothetical protein
LPGTLYLRRQLRGVAVLGGIRAGIGRVSHLNRV